MNELTPAPDDTTPDPIKLPTVADSATEPATEPATSPEDTTPVAIKPLTEVTSATEFASAAEAPEMGFFTEFWDFLVHNKAWWLTPIILVLALVFVLVWFAGTPFAPFIYGA